EAAAPRLQPYEAFGGQDFERLAQGGARNAEQARQPRFVYPFAAGQGVRMDHGAQAVGNLEVQRLPDDGSSHGRDAVIHNYEHPSYRPPPGAGSPRAIGTIPIPPAAGG